MRTLETRRWLSRLTALLVVAAVGLAAGRMTSWSDAQAQSSVRPPAGATTSAPIPGISRGDVPSRATRPTNVTEGRVPGGSLGNRSQTEMWRAVRQGVSGTVSIPDKQAGQLVQSEGDNWRAVRNGPLAKWGVLGLCAILLVLTLFLLGRGRIMIESGRSGKTIVRFMTIERTAHWLLAVSFIILALTGLNISYGKYWLMPLIGQSAFASVSQTGKWLHNYVAFAFMVALVMIFVLWIKDNFPNTYDLKWLAKGGGLFTKGSHPPSKKFNAGQKLIFWSVIIGGIGLSLTGIALLQMFPGQTVIMTKTFAFLNIFGFGLPETLTPLQEMQYATLWHAVIALLLIVVVIAHIYIGSIGMEGAFDAMGTGEVDVNWAREHHSVWTEEVLAKSKAASGGEGRPRAAPAE